MSNNKSIQSSYFDSKKKIIIINLTLFFTGICKTNIKNGVVRVYIYIYCFDLVFSATSTILSNTRTIDQSPPSCELKRSHCLSKVILQSDISRVGEGISNDRLERGV